MSNKGTHSEKIFIPAESAALARVMDKAPKAPQPIGVSPLQGTFSERLLHTAALVLALAAPSSLIACSSDEPTVVAKDVEPEMRAPLIVPLLKRLYSGLLFDDFHKPIAIASFGFGVDHLERDIKPLRFTVTPDNDPDNAITVVSDPLLNSQDFEGELESTPGFCITAEALILSPDGSVISATPRPFNDSNKKGTIYDFDNQGPKTCLSISLFQ